MDGTLAATAVHLAAAAAYTGFQWTVRVVVYPQLAKAATADGGAEAFPALEASHGRRVSRLVGPLFLALVASSAWLVVATAGSPDALTALGAAACTAVVLGVTALGAVPEHRRLGRAWDPAAHRRLVRWDDVRVAAATAQLVLALVLVS
ncbi:hypothetical protein [uncultured Pseudokineococcus sp.]|uniref:hypothetical protein n=1 Tax=uncultured Pseudokineococcus sp. TaxID=1642928 RepID=UPI002618F164|nr:hypothetical protein [uncultured Pseudokineococcus sp.]